MKKLIAVILALLLALTPALSLAEEAKAEKAKLLSLWSEYLAAMDKQIRDDLLWSEAILTLARTKTWDDMLRARATVGAVTSSRSANGKTTLGAPLTAAEKNALIAAGVDVDAFVMEMEDLNSDLSMDLLTTLDISETLLGNCFDTESLEWLTGRAELDKMSAQDEAKWLCMLTNHLLNGMNDEASAASFWAVMDFLYPNIAAFKGDYVSDGEALMGLAETHIISMEKNQMEYSAYLEGVGEHMLNAMTYAMENGDPYFSKENMIVYEDAPTVMPLAPWWGEVGNDIFAAYTMDAEGSLTRLTVDSDLTVVPDVMVVQTSDVGKSEVMAYAEYLKKIGLEASSESGTEREAEAWSVTLRAGPIMLMVRWSNGNAFVWNVGPNVMFVPDWYASLSLQE